jgi:DNA-binding NtrC family response regulator
MANILVIDDDKLIRWSLKEIFSQDGHNIDLAEIPDEALKLTNQGSYDLIFADFELGEEGGIKMIREIRKNQPDSKIVILSAVLKNRIEQNTKDLDIFSIVEKPFKSNELRSITREALRK